MSVYQTSRQPANHLSKTSPAVWEVPLKQHMFRACTRMALECAVDVWEAHWFTGYPALIKRCHSPVFHRPGPFRLTLLVVQWNRSASSLACPQKSSLTWTWQRLVLAAVRSLQVAFGCRKMQQLWWMVWIQAVLFGLIIRWRQNFRNTKRQTELENSIKRWAVKSQTWNSFISHPIILTFITFS